MSEDYECVKLGEEDKYKALSFDATGPPQASSSASNEIKNNR